MSSKKVKVTEELHPYDYNEERYELIEGVRYDVQAAPMIRHNK